MRTRRKSGVAKVVVEENHQALEVEQVTTSSNNPLWRLLCGGFPLAISGRTGLGPSFNIFGCDFYLLVICCIIC